MTYVIPAGFSRLTFEHNAVSTQGSKPSWGIGLDSPPDIDLVNIAAAWWDDEMAPLVPTYVNLERVQMRNDFEVQEVLPTMAGTDTGSFGPPSQSILITLTTGLVGRSNRGRIYFPYVNKETALSGDGVVSGDLITDLNAAFGALLTLLNAEGALPVILHSDSSDPTPVTAWTTQSLSATQRRRLRG